MSTQTLLSGLQQERTRFAADLLNARRTNDTKNAEELERLIDETDERIQRVREATRVAEARTLRSINGRGAIRFTLGVLTIAVTLAGGFAGDATAPALSIGFALTASGCFAWAGVTR
jgi:hypothetical protein